MLNVSSPPRAGFFVPIGTSYKSSLNKFGKKLTKFALEKLINI
jgi:hypothetical protein